MARPSLAQLRAAARTLGVDAVAAEAVEALNRAGCDSILLKGSSFQRELYADGSLRPYVDADLLVSPRDLAAAGAALAGIGFKLVIDHRDHPTVVEPHAQEWQRPPAGNVDLHWRVPGVRTRAFAAWDILETHTVPFPIGNTTARALNRLGIALLVALHAAHHGAEIGKPLEDLGRALERFDADVWRDAALLAQALDSTEAFAAGLRLSAQGAALAHELALPTTVSPRRALMVSGPPPGSLGLLRVLDARRGRARIVRDALLPSARFMRVNYPLARRPRGGLVVAYGQRLVERAWALPAALRAVRAARR